VGADSADSADRAYQAQNRENNPMQSRMPNLAPGPLPFRAGDRRLGYNLGEACNFTLLVVLMALGRATPVSGNSRVKCMFGKFLRNESGATAIEYSLIAGFIALAIIAAVGMTGQRLVELFESLIPALTR
jgi:pilus assembly protein Flp/PilA